MANKLYAMEKLTEEVAKDIAAKPEEWMRFLDTASRLYKYTFDEQLLIFAQRPEATAVASMEVWNKRMYRWIKKGSKGIALIDYTSSPKNRLLYVFDISDTYKVRNLGKDPALWVLPQDDRSIAADYLQRAYGLDEGDGRLAETLHQAAQESVREWLPDAFDELKQDVQGTFLEELDEQNQEVEFRDLMTDSVLPRMKHRNRQICLTNASIWMRSPTGSNLRQLHVAADRKQAEIHFPDHDQQITGTKLRGCGRYGIVLCGSKSPGNGESGDQGKNGTGCGSIKAETAESEFCEQPLPAGR